MRRPLIVCALLPGTMTLHASQAPAPYRSERLTVTNEVPVFDAFLPGLLDHVAAWIQAAGRR